MIHLVVENTYDPPIDEERLNSDAKRVGDCLGLYGASWIRSYLSADRKRMICLFEAPDAEAVRASYRSAGVAFERVWISDVHSRS